MTSSDEPTGGDEHDDQHAHLQVRRFGPVGARRVLIVLGAIIVLAVLVQIWANVWTTKLWFDSLGYSSVFRTEYLTKGLMFLGGGLLIGGLIWCSMWLAFRQRPLYAPSTDLDTMDRYREAIEPFRRAAFWVVPVVFGLFAGTSAIGQWKTALLWLHRQSFGTQDSEFHKDIGFYVFTLPWLQVIVGFLTMGLILALIAAVVMHYLYGGISLHDRGVHTTGAARVHLSVLLAVLVLVRGAAYWLGRYDLTVSDNSLFTGIDYTAQHAVLPAKSMLAGAAVICAVLFVATIWTRTWRLPIVGLSLLIVCALVLGAIYPALVQRFKVRPNEQALQSSYITHNIKATKKAYGLDKVKVTSYTPSKSTNAGQLAQDAETVPGIRLVDPSIVSPTFRQLQGQRNYYQFGNSLDVDRYDVGGKTEDVVVGVRELDLSGVPAGQRNWVNDHTVYTHGFGVVAAYGNRLADGQPKFMESDIPPTGKLGNFEPRIYFGESSPRFSIVGGPKSGPKRELDYPRTSSGGEQRTTYTGGGGVGVGSFGRKLAYAVKYHDLNFLFSGSINSRSRILDTRNPVDRVKKAAPWLTVDGDPYPVVEDGHVQWVVDGYTTSAHYPNSQLQSLGSATSDALTSQASNLRKLAGGQVNYIRNSVKATVDAYTGKVTLYAWDKKDPVLKAWMSAFPGTVKPMSQISSSLMSHLRYPEDLFKVQRELLTKYHVTDPGQFFQGNDQWQVPTDPASKTGDQQPPYYLSLAMPDQKSPKFSLTSTFIPTGDRQNLSAFMAVDADAGSTPGKKSPDYGTFRILEMPRNVTIKGPGQFQNDINSSQAVSPSTKQTLSQFLTYNKQQGSKVEEGNLLTLPVGGGLLYVEPIYVRASGDTSFPLLKAVVVGFGDKLAWDTTLDGALNALFGGDSGASAGDSGQSSPPKSTPPSSPKSPPKSSTSAGNPKLSSALADAQKWSDQSVKDLKKGDFAAYGRDQKKLKEAIKRAIAAQGGTTPKSPSPSSSSSSPAPSSTGK